MKYLIMIVVGIWGVIGGTGTESSYAKQAMPPKRVLAPETYRIALEHYHTIIVTNETLFSLHGRIKTLPGVRQTHAVSLPLLEESAPQTWLLPFGVVSGTEAMFRDEPVPIFETYPFCWDITDSNLVAFHFIKAFRSHWLGAELIVMSFNDFTSAPFENLNRYIMGAVLPLSRLFSTLHFSQDDPPIFFDIVAQDEQHYVLYISHQGMLKAWTFNKELYPLSLYEQRRQLSRQEREKRNKQKWQPAGSWALDFEGSFRALHVKKQTYIFSQTNGTLYLPRKERLDVVTEIPDYFVRSVTGSTTIILDKDRDELWFYAPGREFFNPFAPLHAPRNKETQERLSRIEQAILSLLDLTPDADAGE